jgi:hypothetical protein
VASSSASQVASRSIAKPIKSLASATSQHQVLFATKSTPQNVVRSNVGVTVSVGQPMQSTQSGGLILSAQPVVTMSGAVFATSTIPSIIQTSSFQPQMVQVCFSLPNNAAFASEMKLFDDDS